MKSFGISAMSNSSPICRCRVLYLGSAVPRHSKDGLQGIQEPLRCLYPSDGLIAAKGIDSWLSVWSNGILLENVDDSLRHITKFFSIESLHYCAAVRHVLIPRSGNFCSEQRFLPLDSPFAQMPRSKNPPIFAAILRRTSGIKVLECHVFICKREAAANALVRCCFHSYADNSYARQLMYTNLSNRKNNFYGGLNLDLVERPDKWRSKSLAAGYCLDQNRFLSLNNKLLKDRESKSRYEANQNSVRSEYNSVKDLFGSSTSLNKLCGAHSNRKIWEGIQANSANKRVENEYDVYSATCLTPIRPSRARQISVPVRVQPPEFKIFQLSQNTNFPANDTNIAVGGLKNDSFQCDLYGKISHLFNTEKQFPASNQTFFYSKREKKCQSEFNLCISSLLVKNHLSDSLNHPLQKATKSSKQFLTLQPFVTKNKRRVKEFEHASAEVFIDPQVHFFNHQVDNSKVHKNLSESSLDMQTHLRDSNDMANKRKLFASTENSLDSTHKEGESASTFRVYRQNGHLNERAFSFSIRQEHRSRSYGSLASFESYNLERKNGFDIVAHSSFSDGEDNKQANKDLKIK